MKSPVVIPIERDLDMSRQIVRTERSIIRGPRVTRRTRKRRTEIATGTENETKAGMTKIVAESTKR